jgi:hypothetical protein
MDHLEPEAKQHTLRSPGSLDARAYAKSAIKKNFWTTILFLSFCQKCFLAIFKLLMYLKALLIFLPNDYFFFLKKKMTFLVLKTLLNLSNTISNKLLICFLSKVSFNHFYREKVKNVSYNFLDIIILKVLLPRPPLNPLEEVAPP